MATATFRFHDELNAFLPRAQRDRAFGHACARDATVKHAIEALGVPHTEIGRLCINDVPAALDRPLDDGDRSKPFRSARNRQPAESPRRHRRNGASSPTRISAASRNCCASRASTPATTTTTATTNWRRSPRARAGSC